MAKIEGKVARRYARALFELTQPAQYDIRRAALDDLSRAWQDSDSARVALSNPAVPLDQREAALRDIAAKLLPGDSEFSNFLTVVLSGGRLAYLPLISKLYAELVDSAKRLLSLEIYSAFELPADEKNSLESKIRAECGASATFAWKVDPEILGGLLVKSGDRELDSSVRGALEKIRQQVLGG